MSKKVGKNNQIIIAIICLALIIGLAIGIVFAVINLNTNNQSSVQKDCSLAEDDNTTIECLKEAYENGNREDVETNYAKVAKAALEKEDYSFYIDVINRRVGLLILDEKCDEAMKLLDEVDTSPLSPTQLEYFYGFAKDSALLCNDSPRGIEFGNKHQTLLDSGEAQEFGTETLPDPIIPEEDTSTTDEYEE